MEAGSCEAVSLPAEATVLRATLFRSGTENRLGYLLALPPQTGWEEQRAEVQNRVSFKFPSPSASKKKNKKKQNKHSLMPHVLKVPVAWLGSFAPVVPVLCWGAEGLKHQDTPTPGPR